MEANRALPSAATFKAPPLGVLHGFILEGMQPIAMVTSHFSRGQVCSWSLIGRSELSARLRPCDPFQVLLTSSTGLLAAAKAPLLALLSSCRSLAGTSSARTSTRCRTS
jgi:hypothetical protein